MDQSQGTFSPAQEEIRHQPLPPLLKSFQLWTVLLFAASLGFHLFFRLVFHMHGHMVYPFSLDKHDRFYDFTIFTDKFKLFHTAQFFQSGFPINYPAPVCVVFEFFFKLPHSLACFLTFTVLCLVIPAALFARALILRGVSRNAAWSFCAILCFLSWPAVLMVERANAEVVVWLVLLIAMWAYATGRGWIAAIFFAIAASMKLFPFILLALFLNRRDFKKLLLGVVTFLTVSIGSLAILGPTIPIAYRGINVGLASFKANYMAQWRPDESGVDHSFFALIKKTLLVVAHHSNGFPRWLQMYLLATVFGGIALYFLRIRFMPLLNQVLTLTIASIFLTAFSGDGTLIHLYCPLGMLMFLILRVWRDGIVIPGLALITYCMVSCLSFETFFVIPHDGQGLRFIGQAHAIALGVMLIAALRYPLGPPLSERNDPIVLSHPVTDWIE